MVIDTRALRLQGDLPEIQVLRLLKGPTLPSSGIFGPRQKEADWSGVREECEALTDIADIATPRALDHPLMSTYRNWANLAYLDVAKATDSQVNPQAKWDWGKGATFQRSPLMTGPKKVFTKSTGWLS